MINVLSFYSLKIVFLFSLHSTKVLPHMVRINHGKRHSRQMLEELYEINGNLDWGHGFFELLAGGSVHATLLLARRKQ
jgi:hypothetical protein